MRTHKNARDQRVVVSEILIAISLLLSMWGLPVLALEMEGIESLMGRPAIIEISPEKMRHRLPVRIEKAKGYFLVDQGAMEMVMTRAFVADHALWDYRFVGEVPGGDLVEFKSVNVGKWTLSDVRVVICDECNMLAGQNILNQFTLKNIERDGREYLTLTR